MNKNLSRSWALHRGLVRIDGSFATGAAGAVAGAVPARSSANGEGRGFTVTKLGGTGLYRVTLDASLKVRAKDLIAFHASAMENVLDVVAKPWASDPTAGTYDIQLIVPSTGLAVDQANVDKISFSIVLSGMSTADNN